MLGVLLVTHGTIGESFLQCACHVLGNRPAKLVQVGVTPQDDPSALQLDIEKILSGLDDGSGVLILTDMFGATPSNIAARTCQPGKIELVAGLNLPMLLRVLTWRDKHDIQTVIEKAVDGGQTGVWTMKGRE